MALPKLNLLLPRLFFLGSLSAQFLSAAIVSKNVGDLSKLETTLSDPNIAVNSRIAAARSLGGAGVSSAPIISSLVEILMNKSEDQSLRLAAASALQKLPPNDQTVPAFVVLLKDKKEPLELRHAAFDGYRSAASNSPIFFSAFATLLKDPTEAPAVRDRAGGVLREMVARLAERPKGREVSLRELEERTTRTAAVLDAFKASLIDAPPEVTAALKTLEKRKEVLASQKPPIRRFFSMPWSLLAWPALAFIVGALTWFYFLWKMPLLLWRINQAAQVFIHAKFGIASSNLSALRNSKAISAFLYHPRILDAWMQEHGSRAIQNFISNNLATKSNAFSSIPTEINRLVVLNPSPSSLRSLFQQRQIRMVISGDPGCGKTSLACQIARWASAADSENRLAPHRMLPVMITEGSELIPAGNESLSEAVFNRVQLLGNTTDGLTRDLAHQLLIQNRILVIVDGHSEMSVAAQQSIQLVLSSKSAVNALIITSRLPETILGPETCRVKPLPILPDALPEFIGCFLKALGKRELFDHRELLEKCVRFMDAANGQAISPLMANLYAEWLITTKESAHNLAAPANFSDLLSIYVSLLNHRVPLPERLEDVIVHRLAEVVAWKCLESTFRPSAISRSDLVAALRKESWTEEHLEYLEQKLKFVETTGAACGQLRIGINALAEHLAALHLMERCGASEKAWRLFFAEAQEKAPTPAAIKGFLTALRSACLADGEQMYVPDFVEIELGRLIGFNVDTLAKDQNQRRINGCLDRLSRPDAEARKDAALALGAMGSDALIALPVLLERLRAPQENPEVREAVVKVLPKISGENLQVTAALIDAIRDAQSGLRSAAIQAISQLGDEAISALVLVIHDPCETDDFRVTATLILGAFESAPSSAATALLEILKDRQSAEVVRAAAAEALGRMGTRSGIFARDLIDVMSEGKLLCQSAAKALLAIAPDVRTDIIALVEALDPNKASSSKEILTAFRRSLTQRQFGGRRVIEDELSERIRQALETALNKKNLPPESETRRDAMPTISLAG